MSIKLNGATSGSVELDVPAAVTGGDVSLSLPGAGTVDRLERAGNILQVVQVVKTDSFTTTSSSFVDVTGLSVSITPSATSSKILVMASMYIGTNNTASDNKFQLLRGSTNILTNEILSRSAATGDVQNFAINFLDSPSSTSSLTYKVQALSEGSNETIINARDASPSGPFGNSTITLLEVAA